MTPNLNHHHDWRTHFGGRENSSDVAQFNLGAFFLWHEGKRSRDIAVAAQQLENNDKFKSLMIADPVFEKWEFPLLLNKTSKFGPDFLNRFDKTLRAMKNDGSYKRLVEGLRKAH